ncbi:Polypeptide deformylase [Chitinophaga eiseniae]|uniref:Polypeptide deformylase n=1 Tax=Chitinophaga eiseniae TaxID=634771 RepID=A0A1T4SWN0_9BACT|nr:peptide deformylase [Chitinophaga eiseniae]SKA32572.1 Polypeptide deformylase [Chitinophaga eiseniae]
MILPIIAYGHTILRTPCADVPADFPGLRELVENMWQTLAAARGVGLAAPQVHQPLRLFIVESQSTFDHLGPEERARLFPAGAGIREVFINPKITPVSRLSPLQRKLLAGKLEKVRKGWYRTAYPMK